MDILCMFVRRRAIDWYLCKTLQRNCIIKLQNMYMLTERIPQKREPCIMHGGSFRILQWAKVYAKHFLADDANTCVCVERVSDGHTLTLRYVSSGGGWCENMCVSACIDPWWARIDRARALDVRCVRLDQVVTKHTHTHAHHIYLVDRHRDKRH